MSLPDDDELARPPPHALVVGGTGMLYDVSLNLAVRGYVTTVVARGRERLEELRTRAMNLGGRVEPLPLDYQDADGLLRSVEEAEQDRGPLSLAVLWIHASGGPARSRLLAELASPRRSCRVVEVKGSAEPPPGRSPPASPPRADGAVRAQEVILGFVLEGPDRPRRSRWLTDEEISRGVLGAIDSGAPRSVVGTLEPWSAHP